MKTINFTKMVATGNDFVIIAAEGRRQKAEVFYTLAKKICDRKYGAGADGLLVLEKSKIADIKMRIFNADGSEAEMCGNGARCAALYAKNQKLKTENRITIETKAGVIDAQVKEDNVKIKLTEPKDIELNIPLNIDKRVIKVNFINTGVPHAIIFTEGLDKIDILPLSKFIRYNNRFLPNGTNVDFVEILDNNSIKVRTYERGVEDETLACGTGSVASALVSAISYKLSSKHINVITKSTETLKVLFEQTGNNFKNVWLEGRAKIVYQGVYYV